MTVFQQSLIGMAKNIFITGGLGFLGSALVKELLKDEDNRLFLLVRDKKAEAAEKRTQDLLKGLYKRDYASIENRVSVVKGDITEKNLGISEKNTDALVKKIDIIYHCAALCNFADSLDVMQKVNVEGTRGILDFAKKCHSSGRLKDVGHISTVAIAGKRPGVFYETMLDEHQEFNNPYEQSKFEAEKVVKEYQTKGLNISIFRPSIIVGNSRTGEASNLDMFYQFLKTLSLEIFDEIPANPNSKLNIVPVDSTAKAIHLIMNRKIEKNLAYNITNSEDITLGFGIDIASRFFGFKKPKMTPIEIYKGELTHFQKRVLNPYIPYCNYRAYFDITQANKIISMDGFLWPRPDEKMFTTLFKYCVEINYIRKK